MGKKLDPALISSYATAFAEQQRLKEATCFLLRARFSLAGSHLEYMVLNAYGYSTILCIYPIVQRVFRIS